MRTKRPPTVGLLIDSSRAYGRGLLRAIARCAHGHWCILYHPWELDDGLPLPAWLTQERSQGVIARIESPARLRRLKVPVVNVRRAPLVPGIPMVSADDRRAVQMAIDHLRERGLRRLAYCGFPGVYYSVVRRDYFLAILGTDGDRRWIYEGSSPHGASLLKRESEATFHQGKLGRWLASLPKPIGLIACNDIRGHQVLNACRNRRIAVPDEVAVVGVDDDEILCELADPPLSSVILDSQRAGYEAVALLEKMMRGCRPPNQPIYVAPLGVATRHSTDVLAVEDPSVVAACRIIRDHAREGISVENVLDHLWTTAVGEISRSTLERRFARALGRSPKEEILRVRLEQIKQLLTNTDWPLIKIAAHAGMEHVQYLSALFKTKLGQTPGEFRRRMRNSP